MTSLPLLFLQGHLFVDVEGDRWLLDTGSPVSFGRRGGLRMAGESFPLPVSQLGLDVDRLCELVGVHCAGLLGMDVLGRFDHVLDTTVGRIDVSVEQLTPSGKAVPLEWCMGIPIVPVRVGDRSLRMFLDTGAQFSYLETGSLAAWPDAGVAEDFHPSVGRFEIRTRQVPVGIGDFACTLRCGELPDALALALSIGGVQGVLGNAALLGRVTGFHPRRGKVTLGGT